MATTIIQGIRRRIQRSETVGPVALAMTVGLFAGAGAIVLRWLIRVVQWLFFEQGSRLTGGFEIGSFGGIHLLLAPAIGMVIVSWMVRRWAPEAMGHGVPEVQYAIRRKGGKIRARVAGVKAIASAISIGSGGSVGREGPIVQIGSSLGSSVGQAVGMGPEQTRILVAAGAAGAISATFNAPIAGVMFAMEVILGNFAARSFGLVVISSVTATALTRGVLGKEPAFSLIEQFALVSEWEYLLYLVLGVFTGLVALLYVQSVYWFEDAFDDWKRSPTFKALIGGLAVGALGLFGSQHIFGVGHEGVELALWGELTIGFMLALIVLKMLATSITLGAGGSGGVFAPALFIGAMAGGAFGRGAHMILPAITAPAGAYALVGMAALFAAAAHAPITAIIILFEMTDNYLIILPLMFSVVVAHLIASRVYPDSIYSIKLRRRGGLTKPLREMGILDMLLVTDAMTTDFSTVRQDVPLEEMIQAAQTQSTRSWPVVDEGDSLVGIITVTDIERAIVERETEGRRVEEVMTRALVTAKPGDTLRRAFRLFGQGDVHQIPVVDSEDPGNLVGVLRRTEILWAYKELSDEHQRLLDRTGGAVTEAPEEAVQIELQVRKEQTGVCNKRIREIRLPPDVLIVLLRRGNRALVPRGDSRLELGDVLVFLTTQTREPELRDWISAL